MAVSSLNLNENYFLINNEYEKIVVKYQFHPIIFNYQKKKAKITNTFRFEQVILSDVKSKNKGLNPNKAATHINIPPGIL